VRRVKDFPIRSNAVILKLRGRSWRHKETAETTSRDLSFIIEGNRYTKEAAAIFRDMRRDEALADQCGRTLHGSLLTALQEELHRPSSVAAAYSC
jgi:hypothetical protein